MENVCCKPKTRINPMGPNKGNTATFIKYLLSKHFKFGTLVRSFAKLSARPRITTTLFLVLIKRTGLPRQQEAKRKLADPANT